MAAIERAMEHLGEKQESQYQALLAKLLTIEE
jgi:hypothetical protein